MAAKPMVLMGDINIDLRAPAASSSQWMDVVLGEFCTVVTHVGQWRDVPTRIPTGESYYVQEASSIDVVICSRGAIYGGLARDR